VRRLVQVDALALTPGARADDVVRYVAGGLYGLRDRSLVSSVSRLLVECPAVEEWYLDDDELKDIVDGLGAR
jgi:hypothetical protein